MEFTFGFFMEKKVKSNWKKIILLVILGALSLEPWFLGTLYAQNDEFDEKELEVADLKIRNYELRKEVEKLKSEKAKLQETLIYKEKQLAGTEEDLALISAGIKADEVNAVLLKELSKCRQALRALEQKHNEFREYGRKTLRALKAEEFLLKEYDNKAALVEREMKVVKETVFAAREDGAAYVLSVNADLNVLASSQGYAQGVVQGSEWNVTVNGRKVATIKMIEVRRETSLALITRGIAADIVVGSPLEKKITF